MFSMPYLFTGNGIMVYKSLGVTKGTDLDGATICTSAGTTLEKATADFFTKNNKKYKLLAFENGNERDQAYVTHRCDAMVNGFDNSPRCVPFPFEPDRSRDPSGRPRQGGPRRGCAPGR